MLVGDGLVLLELLLHLLHHLHQSCVEAVLLGRLLVGVDELALLLGESKWKASTPAPAQREKKIIRWSGGSFQAEEGGEERVWECANGPVDHTCNASLLAGRPRFFSAGSQPSVRQQPRLRHPPIWHGLAGPEHAALLVTIVRAALLPVHHYLPRAAARLRSMCAKAVRFPAGAWPPHHGRAALPRPGQARPGLLRLLPAGGGHRMTCRAGLRGLLRGAPPATGARKRRGGSCGNMCELEVLLRSRPAVSSVHECTNRANMGWSRSCKPGLA